MIILIIALQGNISFDKWKENWQYWNCNCFTYNNLF